ncbi:hypothetical protein MG293_002515 [Ovis ammon polii]|uniref:Uncharacterized protein n=1 Tax=Ovis ammon polii TaxID=230172 RepID=A0AAD4ULM6_OVIAM|nr:hypothetical protein MG293_002515 [Ovis ammon polii]
MKETVEEGTSFSCPHPGTPGLHTRMGQRRSPDTPGLKIFGPRGRGLDEMTFRVPPYFRGPRAFPENETQDTVLGGAAFHSPQLPSRWAQLRALGTDSEIPVGFAGADDSRRRNDSRSIGLSRNSPAAGVSLSLGPPWSTERMLLTAEGGLMPMDPRRGWWDSPVIKWGSGAPLLG